MVFVTANRYLQMRCNGFIRFETRRFLAVLLVGVFYLPLAGQAAETTTGLAASQSQDADAAQGSETGDTGEAGQGAEAGENKTEEESEEEPDC